MEGQRSCGQSCQHGPLGHRSSHLATGLSAAAARLGAALAVLVLVLAALGGAAIARLSAHAAHLAMQVGVARHQPRAEGAGIGAVATSPNALGHHLDHFAAQAGRRAVFAFSQASQTSLNARI